MPPDIALPTANRVAYATVSWTEPTASDDTMLSLTSSHTPGTMFSIGETTVSYMAVDQAGNFITKSFVVSIYGGYSFNEIRKILAT